MSEILKHKAKANSSLIVKAIVEETDEHYIFDLTPHEPGPVWQVPKQDVSNIPTGETVTSIDGTEQRLNVLTIPRGTLAVRMEPVALTDSSLLRAEFHVVCNDCNYNPGPFFRSSEAGRAARRHRRETNPEHNAYVPL